MPEASDEEIWAAAKAACIDDYVRGLPQGLNAVIGQDAHPSGGQAQRIAIARALLVDAPSLYLMRPQPSQTRKLKPISKQP